MRIIIKRTRRRITNERRKTRRIENVKNNKGE